MTHPCPVRRCDVTDVPDSKLMCYPDWARVPGPLKKAVNRAWAGGRGLRSTALRAAQRAAIDAVNRQLDEAGSE
jgi:hypothetical protein